MVTKCPWCGRTVEVYEADNPSPALRNGLAAHYSNGTLCRGSGEKVGARTGV